ncbi:MAG: hypothetical protein FJZ15_06880 [Candidatus Omnitrophica bacterium]|nr:hypothetical protein [Candidatus Omnitrophota bacterium]
MARKFVLGIVLFVFVSVLSGCATGRIKQKDGEIQGLRNQVSVLEAQVSSRDEEINSLREELSKLESSQGSMAMKRKMIPEAKSRPSIKQIQSALKNAGFAPGAVDGKMGRQTKDAIKSFQKANNLTADGKVGKKTWELLKEYLYKKVK